MLIPHGIVESVKTTTELKLDYVSLSWEYDFPPEIETALENDFVANQHLYDDAALKRVAALLFIAPDASPQCAVSAVSSRP
jgi:hypothetical protein